MASSISLRVLPLFATLLAVLPAGLTVPSEIAASARNTTLMWSEWEDDIFDWSTALQNAASHAGGGFTDWRLPTVDELVAATQDGSFGTISPTAHLRVWTSDWKGNRAYTVLLFTDASGVVVPSLSGAVELLLKRSKVHARYVRAVTSPPPPGITLSPLSGLITTEAGGSDSFTVVLDSAPSASVSIVVSTTDAAEGLVSTASEGPAPSVTLTFDGTTWAQPQIVTVTGQDDGIIDGNVAYALVTASAVSSDPAYDLLDADDVAATNQDDDQPVVTVTGVVPGGMSAGTTEFPVTITGSNFFNGATVTFENGGGPTPTASGVVVGSTTSITCAVTVGNGGPKGVRHWDLRVTNVDTSSAVLVGGFTVSKP